MDATLKGNGTHRRKADTTNGVALLEARKNKETTCPELGQGNGRVQLVAETKNFLSCLVCEKLCVLNAQRQCSSSGVVFSFVPPQGVGEQEGATISVRFERRQLNLSDQLTVFSRKSEKKGPTVEVPHFSSSPSRPQRGALASPITQV